MKKRAALYVRCSTTDQHTETHELDLRQLAAQRDLEIVEVYADYASGAKPSRPALDRMMTDAARGRFQILLIWSFDRLARSTRHLLETLDALHHCGVELISFREAIDTTQALGKAITVILGAIAELERNLIIERVRAGMRRARIEGRRLGRPPLEVDHETVLRDRKRGMSISQLAKQHGIAETSVRRLLRQAKPTPPKGSPQLAPQIHQNKEPLSAI